MRIRLAVCGAVAVVVLAGGGVLFAQGATSPGGPRKPGTPEPVPGAGSTPVPAGTPGVTPPQLESGKTTIAVEHRLTAEEKATLLREVDDIFAFASKDAQLPIKKPVKRVFTSREEVTKFLRQKFDEDKGNKRMERSELVLKKFGLLDRDFQLRPFLLSLLTEQIAGFYDNKTKTMNLLDWVGVDEQRPVMAHELTHALQDQYVNLNKWQNQSMEGVSKDVTDDNRHIRSDETDTAREAALEGQAMVTFADYLLKDTHRTLRDVPQMAEQLQNGAGDMSGSPVLARAPLLLQESLLFPYTAGLGFESNVLSNGGTKRAFAGVLDNPPNTSSEVMHPDQYLAGRKPGVLAMPDIHPVLTAAGYEPYDIGVMGELDVRITAELFGGKPLAVALTPAWRGGIYYAAQRKNATEAEKASTTSLALFYESQWQNADSARSLFRVFEEQMPRQYEGLKRLKELETNPDERVFSTREGDVLLVLAGNRVWVSEGFEAPLARKLRDAVEGAQGVGPVKSAGNREQGTGIRGQVPARELVSGLASWLGSFGVMRAGVAAAK